MKLRNVTGKPLGLWRSQTQKPVPAAQLVTSIAVLWAAPLVAGWLLIALLQTLKLLLSAELQLTLYVLAMTLVFSPLYSWVGWALALPLSWAMLQNGWFGWLPAAAAGLICGLIAAELTQTAAALPIGPVALLALRALLGRRLPLT